ncbi:hypothetical protein D9611_004077 [Ephemerocybe angulata]|uniref:Aspartate/glutamate/uridylate kinase domain-containing protein n=1 Tax=Ephemerocybe angulata TaxID=980116 RepID=A0A8H5F5F9_9AGAR|nr:hypothetical protein D9611_004077 [Tulosesus angulatus]
MGVHNYTHEMGRSRRTGATVVIKLGTSSIVHETTHQPLLSTLSSVVETVVKLRSLGHKVVLVSSGAIGVGLQRMGLPSRPKNLSGKQALAAIGQGRLIALWDNLFGQFEQPIAQVLLTRGDISDRTRYLNAVNTFKELLSMGVVPIVNENDTVSVSEIKFGDNDTLSAITASMISADYLFLLTDVDGLYTSNPRKDPDARIVETVESVTEIRQQVSTATVGSSLGTGGMETKLIAAEIGTSAGVTTVISSSKRPEAVCDIIAYHNVRLGGVRSGRSTPRSGRSTPTSGRSTPTSDFEDMALTPLPPRPPHTVFTASLNPLRDLKAWTSHTLRPRGSIVIDAGAYRVLSKRTSGGRLLPAGVVGVMGQFGSGNAVRIMVRKHKGSESEEESQRSAYEESQNSARSSTPLPSRRNSFNDDHSSDGDSDAGDDAERFREEDVVEVGRGLANYNHSQINKIKGQNSSLMPRLLGYADSEYVAENITISLPPDSPFKPATV